MKKLISFFVTCMLLVCVCALPSMAVSSAEPATVDTSKYTGYYEAQPDGTWRYFDIDETDTTAPSITPLSIQENITQSAYLGVNSTLQITADVFSGTGTPGTFVYQKVTSIRIYFEAGMNYLNPTAPASVTFSSDRKSCTISMSMVECNPSGQPVGSQQNYSKTFYCN